MLPLREGTGGRLRASWRRGEVGGEALFNSRHCPTSYFRPSKRLTHFERTCGACRSRDEAVEHVFGAIIQSEVLPRSSCVTPMKHRFGSALACMCEQLPGIMISSLLPHVTEHAFGDYDVADALWNDEDCSREGRLAFVVVGTEHPENRFCMKALGPRFTRPFSHGRIAFPDSATWVPGAGGSGW